jgi:hypothetical protein
MKRNPHNPDRPIRRDDTMQSVSIVRLPGHEALVRSLSLPDPKGPARAPLAPLTILA